ncbi:hypothetical protein EDB86DRAFT_333263 [Lactarius hatsudake]|nr:hypothetical protein EDB86DRAFT_333263 [Lactarius hatsudake]
MWWPLHSPAITPIAIRLSASSTTHTVRSFPTRFLPRKALQRHLNQNIPGLIYSIPPLPQTTPKLVPASICQRQPGIPPRARLLSTLPSLYSLRPTSSASSALPLPSFRPQCVMPDVSWRHHDLCSRVQTRSSLGPVPRTIFFLSLSPGERNWLAARYDL